VWKYEHQDASGVVVNIVVLDDCVYGIFNLDPGDVVVSFRVFHDDVSRLAHVQRSVGNPSSNTALDSHAGAANRVDSIQTGVVNFQVAEGHVTSVLRYHSIRNVMLKIKILEDKVASSRQHAIRKFLLAVEHRTCG